MVDTSKRSMPKSKVDWSNIIATRYEGHRRRWFCTYERGHEGHSCGEVAERFNAAGFFSQPASPVILASEVRILPSPHHYFWQGYGGMEDTKQRFTDAR